MSLFRLDASIRVAGSASREIADIVEEEWVTTHPGDRVVRRHLGTDPLPSKIVMQVLPPIDIVAEFGENPDIDEVDAHVRHVMQRALDQLADERRLPILG